MRQQATLSDWWDKKRKMLESDHDSAVRVANGCKPNTVSHTYWKNKAEKYDDEMDELDKKISDTKLLWAGVSGGNRSRRKQKRVRRTRQPLSRFHRNNASHFPSRFHRTCRTRKKTY
jgi:hypothetical protein